MEGAARILAPSARAISPGELPSSNLKIGIYLLGMKSMNMHGEHACQLQGAILTRAINKVVIGAGSLRAPLMCRCMHAGDSGPGMSGMNRVARSKDAVAVSLDTGTVLRDLLQTVAPVTPDSASGSSGGSAAAGKGALRTSASSHPLAGVFFQKENNGPWR